MVQLRSPTATLLAIGLLAGAGLGGYALYQHGRSGDDNEPRSEAPPGQADPRDSSRTSDTHQERPGVPIIIEVVAAFPGASVEEVERQVAIPLEVSLADMPGLASLRSKSGYGLVELYVQFKSGTTYPAARQEVLNRLQFIQALPPGVTPQIASGPGRDTLRYLLTSPRNAAGRPIYTPHDLRALQDGILEREFRRLTGVADVLSIGGAVKRYEIHPGPDRLRRYGVTVQQLADALAGSNAPAGGDHLRQDGAVLAAGSVGLLGSGADSLARARTAGDPQKAADLLRAAEQQRLHALRQLVVATAGNHPIRVEDLIEGEQGVVVGSQPRVDRVASSGPGRDEEEDAVQGVILLWPGEEPRLLRGLRTRMQVLNTTTGKLLPGVTIEPYYASTDAREAAVWAYGTLPANLSPEKAAELAHNVRKLLRELPEATRVVSQVGGWEDGFDGPAGNQVQFFIGLRPGAEAPAGQRRLRTGPELLEAIHDRLTRQVPGVDWLTTAKGPEELESTFPGIPAEHVLRIVGPDLDELERLAGRVKTALAAVRGTASVSVFPIRGQSPRAFRVDPLRCAKWGVQPADVNILLATALGGKTIAQIGEGEQRFDVTLLWPKRFRDSALLDLPVAISNNQVVPGPGPGLAPPGPTTGPLDSTPRLRLRDLVAPPEPGKDFVRLGAAVIYREQGKRLVSLRFSVRGRSLAEVRAEAARELAPLIPSPYRIEWGN